MYGHQPVMVFQPPPPGRLSLFRVMALEQLHAHNRKKALI
jgi:hypothetical protein